MQRMKNHVLTLGAILLLAMSTFAHAVGDIIGMGGIASVPSDPQALMPLNSAEIRMFAELANDAV